MTWRKEGSVGCLGPGREDGGTMRNIGQPVSKFVTGDGLLYHRAPKMHSSHNRSAVCVLLIA